MDGLGLAGEKPTIPAPPNACPPTGLGPVIWLPRAPAPRLGSVGLAPAFPVLLGSLGLALGSEPPPPGLNAPDPIVVPTPPTPPCPMPARTPPPKPIPTSGCPKKPIARGA